MHYYAILAAVAAAATQQTLPAAAPRAAAAPLVKNDKDSTNDEVCVIITGFDTEDTVGDAVASVQNKISAKRAASLLPGLRHDS